MTALQRRLFHDKFQNLLNGKTSVSNDQTLEILVNPYLVNPSTFGSLHVNQSTFGLLLVTQITFGWWPNNIIILSPSFMRCLVITWAESTNGWGGRFIKTQRSPSRRPSGWPESRDWPLLVTFPHWDLWESSLSRNNAEEEHLMRGWRQ